jgi:sensor histidine kinase YesM
MQNRRIKKQQIGENLLYFMVWAAIILVPILASKMLGEEHVNLQKILISWRKISPYLLLFVINNALLAPKLLFKRRYTSYVVVSIVLTTILFSIVDSYERYLIRNVPDIETMIEVREASFTDLALQWNILLGLFMIWANTMIKLLYKNMHDEQEMIALRHENLQAEIDYLKYQINPHFFMNTLNNIHALIDIDTHEAQGAVIELSKMMRYVLY